MIYAVDASDSVLLNAPILVQHDISRLRSSLQQLAPGQRIAADLVDGNPGVERRGVGRRSGGEGTRTRGINRR